jgi:hypothetical protein
MIPPGERQWASPVSGEAGGRVRSYAEAAGGEGTRQDVKAMARMLIRVDAELTDELSHAFPHLTARSHPASTTLTGDVVDQQELQGVLNLLSSLGIDVVEVLTIPGD